MKETKMAKCNEEEEEEDRLSALPDPILTDIISRLPIKSAAATAVLSHRWRHLWTGVTRLEFPVSGSHVARIVHNLLRRLTSPKLFQFQLYLTSLSREGKKLQSFFRDIIRRNVEHVFIDVDCSDETLFRVPTCLFNSQSLLVLDLSGMIKFDLPEFGDDYDVGDFIQLPNLKRLDLNFLVDVPLWLGILINSCPLLEHLDLTFVLDSADSLIEGPVDIRCPNLKSLRIELESSRQTECARFHIDAPILTNLKINDDFSLYYFVTSPSTLVRACVELRKFTSVLCNDDDELVDDEFGEVEYLQHMSKFIRGMSSVTNLNLEIESSTNILAYLYSVDDGFLQIFSNLTHFETTLSGIGLSGWKDLLLLLQCFPNLKHLKVNMRGDPPPERNKWCVPNCVPDCLVTTLDKIHISGLHGSEDDLKLLLEYILSNANLLKELRLRVLHSRNIEEELDNKAYTIWKDFQFCKLLFKLPRSQHLRKWFAVATRHVTRLGIRVESGIGKMSEGGRRIPEIKQKTLDLKIEVPIMKETEKEFRALSRRVGAPMVQKCGRDVAIRPS
ncbi:hypothetical protein RDABS01_003584 [Bienertia sinuspersici]